MKLPPRYYPLTQIVQRPWYLFPFLSKSEDVASTVGCTIYINNLPKWLSERPLGSPRGEAVMQHERVHAYRQLHFGIKNYLIKYASDPNFRKHEELIAWFVQIKVLQYHGLKVNEKSIVKSLFGYSPSLMSKQEAISWVNAVLSNRWQPSKKELPADLHYLLSPHITHRPPDGRRQI